MKAFPLAYLVRVRVRVRVRLRVSVAGPRRALKAWSLVYGVRSVSCPVFVTYLLNLLT